ncbi:H-NS histone family protein (plasmid) [Burkholderia gladioli]|uniref:H-NS histone family protein n=1 Tax=Burkholderia gladioli TaxID=28095 RepID=UPI001364C86F|nr:H-NS histone family protein [Burkholderia gladioli]WAG17933.1 H-NS histone family protein [Burkholderia gladioli]
MTSRITELQSQLRDINIQLADARVEEKRALLAAVKEHAQSLGITQDELLIAAGFKKPKHRRAPAKYYDPSSGNKWSGRGPKPKWLQDKNLDDYLIDQNRPEPQAWWPGE